MPNEEFDKQEFDKRGNDQIEWAFTADSLLTASNFLCQHSYHLKPDWPSLSERFPTFDELRVSDVIIMLHAMAVECLLKALWLKGGGRLAKNGKYQNVTSKNDHDLVSLSNAVLGKLGIEISKEEQDFLERLSRNITAGRYPIQKNWDMQNEPIALGNRRQTSLMVPDYDDDLFASIVEKIREPFKEKLDNLKKRCENENR